MLIHDVAHSGTIRRSSFCTPASRSSSKRRCGTHSWISRVTRIEWSGSRCFLLSHCPGAALFTTSGTGRWQRSSQVSPVPDGAESCPGCRRPIRASGARMAPNSPESHESSMQLARKRTGMERTILQCSSKIGEPARQRQARHAGNGGGHDGQVEFHRTRAGECAPLAMTTGLA